MTRIFNEEGESVPVTVIEAEPNRVTQVKSSDSDGYAAIQVTTGERRRSRVTKAMAVICQGERGQRTRSLGALRRRSWRG